MARPDRYAIARRLAGWLWLAAWLALIVAVLRSWDRLGGLVDERTRWLARPLAGMGAILGATAGGFGRDLARWGSGRSHASLLRWLWLPPAVASAAGMALLTALGREDAVRVWLGAFLGFWGGLDVGFAAWPLACGRPYRFGASIPPDTEEGDRDAEAEARG